MKIVQKLAAFLFGPPERRAEQSYAMGLKELEKRRLLFAEHHFKTAAALAPAEAKYQVAYGNLLLMKGDLEHAVAHYAAAEKTGAASAILYSNWGVALRLTGNAEEGLKRHEQALELGPDDPETLLNACACALALGKDEQAAGFLCRVLEVDPNNADAHLGLAELLGPADREAFIEHLAIAGAKKQHRGKASLLKAAYLLASGEPGEASQLVRQALALESGLCEEIESNPRLRPLRSVEAYAAFMSQREKSMFSCLTEAECSGEMPNIRRGERRSLVVLSFARHSSEAREQAQAALKAVGWVDFKLGAMIRADKRGLAAQGAPAMQGWELAEKNGVHIFVF